MAAAIATSPVQPPLVALDPPVAMAESARGPAPVEAPASLRSHGSESWYTGTVKVGFDANGALVAVQGKEKGGTVAALECIGDPATVGKTMDLVLGISGFFTDGVGAFDLGAARTGFGVVGSMAGALRCSGEFFKGGKAVVEGKISPECVVDLSKGVADAADVVVTLGKMGALRDVLTLYVAKVVKSVAGLLADGFSLWQELVTKPKSLELAEKATNIMPEELLEAKKDENLYSMIKTVVTTVFHIFLAVGAIFLLPLPPIATAVLATACLVTAVIHHFVKSNVSDVETRYVGTQLNILINFPGSRPFHDSEPATV